MTVLEDIILKFSQGGCTCPPSPSDGASKSTVPPTGRTDGGSKSTRPPSCRSDGRSKSTHPLAAASRGEPENNKERVTPSPSLPVNSKSVQASTLGLNDCCKLLDWDGTDEVVATGRISAVDPTTKVHGYKLGPDCYRVEVVEAIKPRAEFYRNQPEFSAMEDAVGSTIAWPIKYIVLDN